MSMAGLDEDAGMFAGVVPTRRRGVWLGESCEAFWRGSSACRVDHPEIVAWPAQPIVASMGGVAATQTLTLIVRGIALGQVERANARWLLTKEVAVAVLNGFAWASVVALVSYLWFRQWRMSAVIFAAMVVNLVAAAFAGVVVPLGLKRFGVDPAVAGGVIVTTVTDVMVSRRCLGSARGCSSEPRALRASVGAASLRRLREHVAGCSCLRWRRQPPLRAFRRETP
jgi:magnesium transporter